MPVKADAINAAKALFNSSLKFTTEIADDYLRYHRFQRDIADSCWIHHQLFENGARAFLSTERYLEK